MIKNKDRPHSIRCLRAIEAYVGDRIDLAQELGIHRGAIDRWLREEAIPGKNILPLLQLFPKEITAEDLLGGNDEKRN